MNSKLDMKAICAYYKDRERLPIGRHRYFSVLAPFVEVDGELCLLFQQRATGNIMSSGEICFPGGHMEPGESPGHCALRETEEEMGIPREKIRFVGRGDTLKGFSGYTLYTTIGEIKYEDYLNMSLEPTEVAEAFLVKVSEFLEKGPYVYESDVIADRSDFPYELAGISEDYPWSMGKWDTVIYNVNDINGVHRIVWGITGGLVRHIMDQISEISEGYR